MKTRELKWFTDRIGKVVYRNKTTCDCDICNDGYNKGLLIRDEFHAEYVYDICMAFNSDGDTLKYFDTIEERDEFELTLKN